MLISEKKTLAGDVLEKMPVSCYRLKCRIFRHICVLPWLGKVIRMCLCFHIFFLPSLSPYLFFLPDEFMIPFTLRTMDRQNVYPPIKLAWNILKKISSFFSVHKISIVLMFSLKGFSPYLSDNYLTRKKTHPSNTPVHVLYVYIWRHTSIFWQSNKNTVFFAGKTT